MLSQGRIGGCFVPQSDAPRSGPGPLSGLLRAQAGRVRDRVRSRVRRRVGPDRGSGGASHGARGALLLVGLLLAVGAWLALGREPPRMTSHADTGGWRLARGPGAHLSVPRENREPGSRDWA